MLREPPVRNEFTFFHRLRVRWAEVDAQRVVFNVNYLAYVDVAFTEYQRALGLPYPAALLKYGADQFAVRAETDFVNSALYDDELDLAVRAEYLGRTSFRMKTAIFRADELLTQVRMTYVNVTLHERKPLPLADEFVRTIEAFERTRPLRK
ncbi:MAG: 4-hydroxybenzoyl-CoA thioesterase [Myxococcaceae bacterium]|nr:4-hydroxybenzoyl-CoA thioesterase [Myxococcaceae bacterium]